MIIAPEANRPIYFSCQGSSPSEMGSFLSWMYGVRVGLSYAFVAGVRGSFVQQRSVESRQHPIYLSRGGLANFEISGAVGKRTAQVVHLYLQMSGGWSNSGISVPGHSDILI